MLFMLIIIAMVNNFKTWIEKRVNMVRYKDESRKTRVHESFE